MRKLTVLEAVSTTLKLPHHASWDETFRIATVISLQNNIKIEVVLLTAILAEIQQLTQPNDDIAETADDQR